MAKFLNMRPTSCKSSFGSFWQLLPFLTYRQARRTVLQPLRTEIFKKQLDGMTQVLQLFIGKAEHQLLDDFAFDELYSANIALLYDH
ncbi:MAG TPA: hypothetical protein VFB61_17480, partial [Gemmatimonadales bacterium]|nr:hypothetical protein [Gemmatimonadales bacterium]